MSAVIRPQDFDWAESSPDRYPTLRSALWLSAEDMLRLALQSYYATVKAMTPPPGERWIAQEEPGLPWSGPEELYTQVLHDLGERIFREAIERGHAVPNRKPLPGAGRSPAVEGQGRPALLSAVGPAAGELQAADITRNADPLFCASGVQELPFGETLPHTRSAAEETQ